MLAGFIITLVINLFGCTSEQVKVSPNSTNNKEQTMKTNTDTPKIVQPTNTQEPSTTVTPTTKLEAAKADNFYIEEVVRNYEILLIEAINNNDFSLIKNVLIPNSNLYNLQKELVADLYNKNIKERLVKFDIINIQNMENSGVYKVYVSDNIAIKYPDKQDFETKEYNWIYTVIKNKNSVGLSDIEKWVK